MLQTILGSGGAIGTPLAKELPKYADRIRLVSRNPKKVNESDELFSLDFNDRGKIGKAIEGSDVVYITVGFPYNLKTWQSMWPPFIQAVTDACEKHNSRLVFFDNIYMYDRSAIPFMTENSPVNPPSKKGEVRARLREMILNEVEKKKLTALIARSADFYGPGNVNSGLNIMVFANLLKGRKAQISGDPDKVHTYTFTPDAGKATAILGNTPDAFGQEWHLPTTKEKVTNLGWVQMVAAELGKKPLVQVVPEWMIKAIGIFVPMMREFPEMLYQYRQDYIFDSSKFEKRFGITATPPLEGIRKMISL